MFDSSFLIVSTGFIAIYFLNMEVKIKSFLKENKLKVMKLGLFSFSLLLVVTFAIREFKHTARAEELSGTYTGCLKSSGASGGFFGQFYNFQSGTSPLLECATGDLEVNLGDGDITSIIAGTGLFGGASSGSATLSIAESYRLPQTCSTDEIVKWNGSAWVCQSPAPSIIAKEATVGGGTTTTTTAAPGSAVSLSGTTVSFSSAEITGPTVLAINWTGRFSNSGAGNSVDTSIMVDSNFVAGTRVVVPIADQWTQHAITKQVVVSSGAHTVEIYWNTLGGTAKSADTQLTVLAIPQ